MPTRSEQHRPAHAVARSSEGWRRPHPEGSSTARGYGYRWQRARAVFLAHNPLCDNRSCPYPSNEVHHKIPHRGDQVLFWDVSNWQALCKACHSAETAREVNERRKVQR